jgi:hypothetical protein
MQTFQWQLHLGLLSWTLFTQSMCTIGETLESYVSSMRSHPLEVGPISILSQWVTDTAMWIPRLSLMFTTCSSCSRHAYEHQLALLLETWVKICNRHSHDGPTKRDKFLRAAFEIHHGVNVNLHMLLEHERSQPINQSDRLSWLPLPIEDTFDMEKVAIPPRNRGGIDLDTFVNCIVPQLIKGTFHGSQHYYFHNESNFIGMASNTSVQ